LSRPAPTRATAPRYDAATVALHWTTVLLVAALWLIGQTIDDWPKGAPRVDYRSVHMTLGVLLGLVILARIAWRATRGARVAPEGPWILTLAARAVHLVLYGLLCATVSLGVLTAFAQGDSVYALFTLPTLTPGSRALAHTLFWWHSTCADTLVVLAGLHAAAALMHHLLLRDDTLRRMLPVGGGDSK
jgi:cytochrome b561